MPYYDTIEEDLKRAKEILEKGRNEFDLPHLNTPIVGGTIYGADTYPAYKLLESFVAEVERLRALQDALVEAFYDPDPADPTPAVDYATVDWVRVVQDARTQMDRLKTRPARPPA